MTNKKTLLTPKTTTQQKEQNFTIDTVQMLASGMEVSVPELLDRSDVTYAVVSSTVDIEGTQHNTYGIAVTKDGIELERIEDISTDFNAVKELAFTLTAHKLSPLHLTDIIEDFLG